MNHNFKEIKETYNYVYAIINSDFIGRKFLQKVDNKIGNKLSRILKKYKTSKSEEKIRRTLILMNIIMMKLANKKEEQTAFFSLFLKIIFKTWGCLTNRTVESIYTMKKVMKHYENEKKE
tara:strand:- start:666 stop:1025 length:360 start_codon:yes stop_codon:yes gene_type:complete